jgi:hypothetical protein
MRRIVFVLALTLVALFVAAPAYAGGWAIGTLDEASPALTAGESRPIGYTILQHGRTPVDLQDTGINARSLTTGEVVEFAGRGTGEVGHYVADVKLPAAGMWAWSLGMDWFGDQDLGTITVVAPGAPVAAPATPETPSSVAASTSSEPSSLRRIGLPVLAAVACGLFASQLSLTVRRRHSQPVAAR